VKIILQLEGKMSESCGKFYRNLNFPIKLITFENFVCEHTVARCVIRILKLFDHSFLKFPLATAVWFGSDQISS
jgi:hypothetical protein